MPSATESVRYWTCEAIHRLERGDRAPEEQVDDDHQAEHGVRDEGVDAPAARDPALGLRAVARRRGARAAADEEAAGVGGIGAQGSA